MLHVRINMNNLTSWTNNTWRPQSLQEVQHQDTSAKGFTVSSGTPFEAALGAATGFPTWTHGLILPYHSIHLLPFSSLSTLTWLQIYLPTNWKTRPRFLRKHNKNYLLFNNIFPASKKVNILFLEKDFLAFSLQNDFCCEHDILEF